MASPWFWWSSCREARKKPTFTEDRKWIVVAKATLQAAFLSTLLACGGVAHLWVMFAVVVAVVVKVRNLFRGESANEG